MNILSEAILKGSELTGQAFGNYFGLDQDDKLTACAWGAAYIGIKGFTKEELNYLTPSDVESGIGSSDDPLREIAFDDEACYICPQCKAEYYGIDGLVFHLNDDEMLTREKIASIVEDVWQPAI